MNTHDDRSIDRHGWMDGVLLLLLMMMMMMMID